MNEKIKSEIRNEYKNHTLIQLIRKQIELSYLEQSSTVELIINHQKRLDSDILFLRFISEKIKILRTIIDEKKDDKGRRR